MRILCGLEEYATQRRKGPQSTRRTDDLTLARVRDSTVRIDSEENTLSFKLVSSLKQHRPFVICEIINPAALTLPQVGSQLRVYGVSRYDGQPDHQWYEIHPVIKIETMNP